MHFPRRVITRLIPEDDFVSLQNYGLMNFYEVMDKVTGDESRLIIMDSCLLWIMSLTITLMPLLSFVLNLILYRILSFGILRNWLILRKKLMRILTTVSDSDISANYNELFTETIFSVALLFYCTCVCR